jgi:Serine dehydrogenase proteinase
MPNWRDLLDELKKEGSTHDRIRRKYLSSLYNYTKRNVIVYYSGWLQKPDLQAQTNLDFGISDGDKTGFMTCVHKLDRSRGLDLLLHTPGGSMAATESLVYYLRGMFRTNIRAIVPQIAMSGGTMVACACNEIVMGEHSSLGPIDPQTLGMPAHGVVEEFDRARNEIRLNQSAIPLWQPIIAKYRPTLIGECQKAIKWSTEMTTEWLKSGMFSNGPDAGQLAEKVVQDLGDHALTKSHDRHIDPSRAKEFGLNITRLEEDSRLQDLVLTVHHACIQTLSDTAAFKIIENHKGVAYIRQVQVQHAVVHP